MEIDSRVIINKKLKEKSASLLVAYIRSMSVLRYLRPNERLMLFRALGYEHETSSVKCNPRILNSERF